MIKIKQHSLNAMFSHQVAKLYWRTKDRCNMPSFVLFISFFFLLFFNIKVQIRNGNKWLFKNVIFMYNNSKHEGFRHKKSSRKKKIGVVL